MLSPLRRNMGHLVTQEMKKAQELKDVFPQSSTAGFPAMLPKLQRMKARIGKIKSYPL